LEALRVQEEMLIPIQKALVQTFKYSPLLILTVFGLNQQGLLWFIWKLLGVVLVEVAALPKLVEQREVEEVVVAHLPDN